MLICSGRHRIISSSYCTFSIKLRFCVNAAFIHFKSLSYFAMYTLPIYTLEERNILWTSYCSIPLFLCTCLQTQYNLLTPSINTQTWKTLSSTGRANMTTFEKVFLHMWSRNTPKKYLQLEKTVRYPNKMKCKNTEQL